MTSDEIPWTYSSYPFAEEHPRPVSLNGTRNSANDNNNNFDPELQHYINDDFSAHLLNVEPRDNFLDRYHLEVPPIDQIPTSTSWNDHINWGFRPDSYLEEVYNIQQVLPLATGVTRIQETQLHSPIGRNIATAIVEQEPPSSQKSFDETKTSQPKVHEPVSEELVSILNKRDCLRLVTQTTILTRRQIQDLNRTEEEDVFSHVILRVPPTRLDPKKNSEKCRTIVLEESFRSSLDKTMDFRRFLSTSQIPRDRKAFWIPCTVSKATGHEKDSSTANEASLCGMINFRCKRAWRRRKSTTSALPWPSN